MTQHEPTWRGIPLSDLADALSLLGRLIERFKRPLPEPLEAPTPTPTPTATPEGPEAVQGGSEGRGGLWRRLGRAYESLRARQPLGELGNLSVAGMLERAGQEAGLDLVDAIPPTQPLGPGFCWVRIVGQTEERPGRLLQHGWWNVLGDQNYPNEDVEVLRPCR